MIAEVSDWSFPLDPDPLHDPTSRSRPSLSRGTQPAPVTRITDVT
jgi:hypothetical protein